MKDRDWHYIKSCRALPGWERSPYTCRGLVQWISDGITFAASSDHAVTMTQKIEDAVGYDIEKGNMHPLRTPHPAPSCRRLTNAL